MKEEPNSHIPKPVLTALLHVRSVFPDVCLVVYGRDGRWHYTNEEFDSPTFDSRVDIGTLEDAADSLEQVPAVFQLDVAEEEGE